MNKHRIVISVAALMLTSQAFADPLNAPGDVKAITDLEEKLATLTSMKDLIQYYADDAVVLDSFAPGYFRGKKQIYDGFEAQFANVKSFKHEMSDLNIITNGNFACAAMQLRFHFVGKDGTEGDITLRQLDAFKKSGKDWRIVQQHISFPMDAKTGMGLTNAHMPPRGKIEWAKNSFAGPAVAPEQAKREIVAWLEEGVLAPDLDALVKYYGPGDDVIVYDALFPPGEFRGLKEVRAGFAPVMNYTNPKVKMLDLVVDSDGEFGVQIDVQDITVTEKNGTQRNFLLRQSDCMRRVDGKWYSVMEALSFPIDPKTGKAVTDPGAFAKPDPVSR